MFFSEFISFLVSSPMTITSLTNVAAWTGTAAAIAAARRENSAFFMVGPFGRGGRFGPVWRVFYHNPAPARKAKKGRAGMRREGE